MTTTKVDITNEYREIIKSPKKISKAEINEALGELYRDYKLTFTLFYNTNSKKWVFIESNKIPYNISRVSIISDKLNVDLSIFKNRQQVIDYIHSQIINKILNIKKECIKVLNKMGVTLPQSEIKMIFTIYKK